jgi:hypothetical protein
MVEDKRFAISLRPDSCGRYAFEQAANKAKAGRGREFGGLA